MIPIPPLAPQLDEGIDRRTHNLLRDRFLHVNRARLDRALDSMSPRQQNFVRSLPLLLHVNHAGLPGYVSTSTPCGIRHYLPGPDAQRALAQFTRAYRHDPGRPVEPDIRAVFLMGSTGTVGQSSGSDLDIWVCHERDLDEGRRSELRAKLAALEAWAATLNLEVHFFVMAPDHFRERRHEGISTEDCGTSQHTLLLDEFYRTSLLLAGCMPLWWMIPAYDEHRYDGYAETLLGKRFLPADHYIDFGGIPVFPADEFIGAGLWQLYKGISSPYKSVLKIVLTEVYSAEYPHTECLSLRYKRMIYEGVVDLDELDPYVMMYRKIEEHLNQPEHLNRLELIRHCFYSKVNEALTRESQSKTSSWRYQLMRRFTHEWQWSTNYIRQLDNRHRWKANRVRQEYQALMQELNHSYRVLLSFCQSQQIRASIDRSDVDILARKLHAAFDRQKGKIELFNPGIADDISEEQVSLHFVHDEFGPGASSAWFLYRGSYKKRDVGDQEPLRQSPTLIELLTWCHCNGIVDTSTHFTLDTGGSDLTEGELQRLLQHIRQRFATGAPKVDIEAFKTAHTVKQVVVFVNVGVDALRDMTQRGMHFVSEQQNVLSFSAQRHNLILSIDEIEVNSWGEIICYHYRGRDALIQVLRRQVQSLLEGAAAFPLDVICESTTRATLITSQVSQLFSDVLELFAPQGPDTHDRQYVLEIEHHRYVIGSVDKQCVIHHAANDAELCLRLSLPRKHYVATQFDRHALPYHPLRDIVKIGTPGHIQLFYLRRGNVVDVYVHDERGGISWSRREAIETPALLAPWIRFFQSLYIRRQAAGYRQDAALAVVHVYELIPKGRLFSIERRPSMTPATTEDFLDVHAMVERNDAGGLQFALFCDEREFSHPLHGEGLFRAAATYLLEQRRGRERYPLYITDLDLSSLHSPADPAPATAEYLLYKRRLEERLNAALNSLPHNE